MTKKSIFYSAGALTAVAAFAVGVAVPIAVNTHVKDWNVKIANKDGAHYVLTKLDPKQNKAALTDAAKATWDLVSTTPKTHVAKFLGITEDSQVQFTIKAGKNYDNGLQKLLFDLTSNQFSKNNGDSFTLDFSNTAGGSKIKFDNAFVKAAQSVRKADIHDFLATNVDQAENVIADFKALDGDKAIAVGDIKTETKAKELYAGILAKVNAHNLDVKVTKAQDVVDKAKAADAKATTATTKTAIKTAETALKAAKAAVTKGAPVLKTALSKNVGIFTFDDACNFLIDLVSINFAGNGLVDPAPTTATNIKDSWNHIYASDLIK